MKRSRALLNGWPLAGGGHYYVSDVNPVTGFLTLWRDNFVWNDTLVWSDAA